MGGRAYVGTSGWQYRDWRGRFYPEDIPQRKWLDYIGHELDSVEVNGTFYRFPRRKAVSQWSEEAPAGFRFAFKVYRGISHYRKMKDSGSQLSDFFWQVDPVPARQRGPLLTQLPPNQGQDVEKLDAYLATMKKTAGKRHWKRAVEFRNDEWYDEETYKVLDKHRTALCVHDMKGAAPVDEPNDASFIYMRRHGPGGNTQRGYDRKAIRRDARQIEDWLDGGKTVFVYYNNDGYAHAPQDAEALKEVLDSDR